MGPTETRYIERGLAVLLVASFALLGAGTAAASPGLPAPVIDTAARSIGPTTIGGPVRPRADEEHVVLADCRDTSTGVFSSQVAYFPGPPGPKPQDVAVVTTTEGELRVWAGQKTKVLFTSTGTNFTVTLGPQVTQGEFAGTAFNDWVGFNCFYDYQKDLYRYDGRLCAMAYDCNHKARPATTGASSSSTTTSTSTTSSTSRASSSGGAADTGSTQGLSLGAMIGVIVGSVVAGAIAIGAAIFVWVHKRREKKFSRATEEAEAARRMEREQLQHKPLGAVGPAGPYTPYWEQKDGGQRPAHELDGQWHGVEVEPDTMRTRELDGTQLSAELEGERGWNQSPEPWSAGWPNAGPPPSAGGPRQW